MYFVCIIPQFFIQNKGELSLIIGLMLLLTISFVWFGGVAYFSLISKIKSITGKSINYLEKGMGFILIVFGVAIMVGH